MNKRFLLLMASAACLLSSCGKDNEAVSSSSHSQALKPVVAIAPVIDNSESGLSWDVSDEITYSLSSRLVQKNKLNIADPQKTKNQLKKAKVHGSPFAADLEWIKKTFASEDFVVFMELIEHREKIRESAENPKSPESLPADLNVALRIRIIDVRSDAPAVVLQEIIQDSHFIPRQFTKYNFEQAPWNSEEFSISPVGIAHSLLIKEVCSRIEDYISLARS